jgi:hypothetical protein
MKELTVTTGRDELDVPTRDRAGQEARRGQPMPAGDEGDVLTAKKVPAMERDAQEELRLPRRVAERLQSNDAIRICHRR